MMYWSVRSNPLLDSFEEDTSMDEEVIMKIRKRLT
jgi:hypothetical protein